MKDELKMVRDLKKMNELVERLSALMRSALGGNIAQKKATQPNQPDL